MQGCDLGVVVIAPTECPRGVRDLGGAKRLHAAPCVQALSWSASATRSHLSWGACFVRQVLWRPNPPARPSCVLFIRGLVRDVRPSGFSPVMRVWHGFPLVSFVCGVIS